MSALDAPMRLEEAVEALKGKYPITVSMLRTEIRKGRLTPAVVAGKFFVTVAQIRDLFTPCPAEPKAHASTSEPGAQTGEQASRFLTSGSSVTERMRAAQAAALASNRRPNARSETTSPASSRRRSSKPTADVIQGRF